MKVNFIEQVIIKSNTEMIRVSICYRTGVLNSYNKLSFLTEMDTLLSRFERSHTSDIICGDFNIHVQDQGDNFAKEFLDLIESYGFHQQIKGATHAAGSTLDLLFVRESFMPSNINIFNHLDDIALSDHYLITASFPIGNIPIKTVTYSSRNISSINTDNFCHDLHNQLYTASSQNSTSTIDSLILNLSKSTSATLNKHAPIIFKSKRTSSKVFTNQSIIEARKLKRRAERKFKKSGLKCDKNKFKDAAKKLIITVQQSHNAFYSNKLKEANNDTKTVYSIINKLLHNNKEKILPINSNKRELANKFAYFFEEKVGNIVKSINTDYKNINTNRVTVEASTLHESRQIKQLEKFNAIDINYLEKLIRSTKAKFSSVDDIPAKLIKPILNVAIEDILKIINISLCDGVFPDHLKMSHITPIVKNPKDDTNCYSNFRPIINLPILSKLINYHSI